MVSRRWHRLIATLFAAMFLLTGPAALGATRTWSGASINDPAPPNDNFWTNPLNWVDNIAPVPGDDLIFQGGFQTSSTNTFPDGTTFNTITLSGHDIGGAPIALNAGLSATDAEISLSIKLNNNQTFTSPTSGVEAVVTGSIDNNGKKLTLAGPGDFTITGLISGTGGLHTEAAGTRQLFADNTYTGATTWQFRLGAHLFVFGSQPGSSVMGQLGGTGTIGPFLGGSISPGAGSNTTGILTVNGGLTISTGGWRLFFDFKGPTVGSEYDQIKVVNGEVDLGTISELGFPQITVDPSFTPAVGSTFVIIDNDGTDAIQGASVSIGEGRADASAGDGLTFVTSYRGGDGNDVVLRVARAWDSYDDPFQFWTTGANWAGDFAPVPGDLLYFQSPGPGQRLHSNNDFPDGTPFAGILLWLEGNYRLFGNAITLGADGLRASLFGSIARIYPDITLAGPTLFEAGPRGSLLFHGALDLGPHQLTVSALSCNILLEGPLTGTGEIHKFGDSTSRLDMTGEKTFSSAIRVFGGDLFVGGSQPNAPIFMDPDGTAAANEMDLTGTGTTGPLTIGGVKVSGGFGDEIGTLTVNGGANFAGNATVPATLEVRFEGEGPSLRFDQLNVMGAVTLGNAALVVSAADGFVPPAGATFILINNDGTDPVQGTFASRPEGSSFNVGFVNFTLSYQGGDGNDVVLKETTGSPTPTPTRLGNLSTRARILTGDKALIGGMIATGNTNKRVIIRAIGPTLTDLGVPGALADPKLDLFQGNSLVFSNDDWRNSPQKAEIENSGFAPGKDTESAIIMTLTPNQNYTAIVSGKNGETGIGLMDAFDLEPGASSKLANISARGVVDLDDNRMIAGLIVGPPGGASLNVVVRALGPTLGDFGVQGFLANPKLDLVDANGTILRSNDSWKSSQAAQIQAANLAPKYDAEAALVHTLPPGQYTAIVSGVDRTTGVGLVEVYDIPD